MPTPNVPTTRPPKRRTIPADELDELAELADHIEATKAGAELTASNITTGGER